MNCHANKSIECTVQQCAHHCQAENYCSLDKILVGTHEQNPAMDQCTDCKSFRKKYLEKRWRKPPLFLGSGLDGWRRNLYDKRIKILKNNFVKVHIIFTTDN